ncbi:MAG: hypothetical protein WCL61_00335 [bacterium]
MPKRREQEEVLTIFVGLTLAAHDRCQEIGITVDKAKMRLVGTQHGINGAKNTVHGVSLAGLLEDVDSVALRLTEVGLTEEAHRRYLRLEFTRRNSKRPLQMEFIRNWLNDHVFESVIAFSNANDSENPDMVMQIKAANPIPDHKFDGHLFTFVVSRDDTSGLLEIICR